MSQPTPTGTETGLFGWVVAVMVLLATGLFALSFMALTEAGATSANCYPDPGCYEAADDAFDTGFGVFVGSLFVAEVLAVWRRRHRLLYLALLGYALAVWVTDWGVHRAVARWRG